MSLQPIARKWDADYEMKSQEPTLMSHTQRLAQAVCPPSPCVVSYRIKSLTVLKSASSGNPIESFLRRESQSVLKHKATIT